MKKYGIRIGNIGVEFPSIEDRSKAINVFTKGTDVKISESGIRYSDGKGSFSVYDRDTKEIITNCHMCQGVFLHETCPKRAYPYKNSWEKEFSQAEDYICDACLASQEKAKKIFDAEQTLKEGKED